MSNIDTCMSIISSCFPPNPFAPTSPSYNQRCLLLLQNGPLEHNLIELHEHFKQECTTLSRDQILISLYIFYFSNKPDLFIHALIHVAKALIDNKIDPKSFCEKIEWVHTISYYTTSQRSSLQLYREILQRNFNIRLSGYSRPDDWYTPTLYSITPFHTWHGLCYWIGQVIQWPQDMETSIVNSLHVWAWSANRSLQEIKDVASLLEYFQILSLPIDKRDNSIADALQISKEDYFVPHLEELDLAKWQSRPASEQLLLSLITKTASSQGIHQILFESVLCTNPDIALNEFMWATRCCEQHVAAISAMIERMENPDLYLPAFLTAIMQGESISIENRLQIVILGCERLQKTGLHLVDIVNLLQELVTFYSRSRAEMCYHCINKFALTYDLLTSTYIRYSLLHCHTPDMKHIFTQEPKGLRELANSYINLCDQFEESIGATFTKLCVVRARLVAAFVDYSCILANAYKKIPIDLTEKNYAVVEAVKLYRQISACFFKHSAFRKLQELSNANCTQSPQEIKVSMSKMGKLVFTGSAAIAKDFI